MEMYEKYMRYGSDKPDSQPETVHKDLTLTDPQIPSYDFRPVNSPNGMYDMHGSLDLITGKNANRFFSLYADEQNIKNMRSNLDTLIALEDYSARLQ